MSASRGAEFYQSFQEVIQDIPDGAKLLVGGLSSLHRVQGYSSLYPYTPGATDDTVQGPAGVVQGVEMAVSRGTLFQEG